MKFKLFKFNSIAWLILTVTIALFATQNYVASQDTLTPTDKIKFKGKIIEDKDLSGIGFVGKYLLIGSDEGNTIQVLEPNQKRSKYRAIGNIELLADRAKPEIDIEGIAVIDNTVYVLGSHSTPKKAKKDSRSRKNVFRFQLNPATGELQSPIEQASLQAILERDEILSQFANLPYSKNGVDIEGIAIKGDRLYFGFRTPILKDNHIPLVIVKFENLNRSDLYELRRLNLDGNAIRDLVAVDGGFLILTDATGNKKSDYRVYFWDGGDDLTSSNVAPTIKFMSEIPTKKNTRAEGLTILTETSDSYRILVVYDGVAKGNPTIFEIQK